MNLYAARGGAGHAALQALPHRAARSSLSDSLPMLERMGLRVLEERPYRIAPEGGAAGLDPRLRARDRRRRGDRDRRGRRDLRGRVRPRLRRRDRERRLQPAGARRAPRRRRDRGAARLREVPAPDRRSRSRRRSSSRRSPRNPAIARMLVEPVPAALRSRAARTTTRRRRRGRCRRDRGRRSTRSRT